jgi:hypothetical protein
MGATNHLSLLISSLIITLFSGLAFALTDQEISAKLQALQKKAVACGQNGECMRQVQREFELMQMELNNRMGDAQSSSEYDHPTKAPCYGVQRLWAEDAARTGQPPYDHNRCYNVQMVVSWKWDEEWISPLYGSHKNYHVELQEEYQGRLIITWDQRSKSRIVGFQIDGPLPAISVDATGATPSSFSASVETNTKASGLPCCPIGVEGKCNMTSAKHSDFIAVPGEDNTPFMSFDYSEYRIPNEAYSGEMEAIQPRLVNDGDHLCNEGAGYGRAFDHPFQPKTADTQKNRIKLQDVHDFLDTGNIKKYFTVDYSMKYYGKESHRVKGDVVLFITKK